MPQVEIEISSGDIDVISVPVTTVSVTLLEGGGFLAGWSLRETTGAATATVEVTSGGNPVAEISLSSGGSDTQWLGDHGVEVNQDITMDVISGSVAGAFYVAYRKPWLS